MNRIMTRVRIPLLLLLFLPIAATASWPKYFNSTAAKKWSQADRVVRILKIQKGQMIADIGAGGGYFSVLLARATGSAGKIYAADISTRSLDFINRYAHKQGVKNVITILARQDHSGLQNNSVDLVFLRNTYHHISKRVAYFRRLIKVLKPGARVVIIDYHPWISIHHSTKESLLHREMRQAGYRLIKRYTFLKRQNFNIFVVR